MLRPLQALRLNRDLPLPRPAIGALACGVRNGVYLLYGLERRGPPALGLAAAAGLGPFWGGVRARWRRSWLIRPGEGMDGVFSAERLNAPAALAQAFCPIGCLLMGLKYSPGEDR
jgi:hypothetical protein